MCTSSSCSSLNGIRAACPRRRACRPACFNRGRDVAMSDWTTVAKLDELPPGARRIVDVDGVSYAIVDLCPHDYAPRDTGMAVGDEIICPRHGARFCIKTGAVTAPPAYEPVTTFPVRIHEGLVQVRDPRWD